MLPYWVLFLAWTAAALAQNRLSLPSGIATSARTKTSAGVYMLVIGTALLMGLRFEIGADWVPYLEHYETVQFLSVPDAVSLPGFDLGYSAIVILSSRLNGEMWLVNLSCALIMVFGVARFCARQPNPALCFVVAIPYLIIVVGMGYTRQAVAIGIILAGIADFDGGSIVKITLFVLVAALFHKTAILVLPLILAPFAKRRPIYLIFGALVFVALFFLLLRESADALIANYIDADYESRGAAIRVAMNFLPAVLALALRKRLGFNSYQSEMWSLFALVAIATLPLVLAANFTTAIDRLALFLIPLQIVILPRIPYVFGTGKAVNALMMIGIIGYSGTVQFVWLVFATHAEYWVPYNSYLSS